MASRAVRLQNLSCREKTRKILGNGADIDLELKYELKITWQELLGTALHVQIAKRVASADPFVQ